MKKKCKVVVGAGRKNVGITAQRKLWGRRGGGVGTCKAKIQGIGEEEFTAEVLDAEVPVLVDFWAQWYVGDDRITSLRLRPCVSVCVSYARGTCGGKYEKRCARDAHVLSVPHECMRDEGKRKGGSACVCEIREDNDDRK